MFELDRELGFELERCGYDADLINEDLLMHFSNIAQHFPIDSDDNYQKASDVFGLINGSIAQMTVYLDVVKSQRDVLIERMRAYSCAR